MVKNIFAAGLVLLAISLLVVLGFRSDSAPLALSGSISTIRQSLADGFETGTGAKQSVVNDLEVTKSPDGFVIWKSFTVSTTTSAAKAVFTNTLKQDLVCSGPSGAVYASSTDFAPGLAVSIGTSTSATGYSTNLTSSTTIATSTGIAVKTMTDISYIAPFVLRGGESIVGSLSDIVSNASSTYFTRRNLEMSFHCWTVGE